MRRTIPRALSVTFLAIALLSAAMDAAEADKIKHSIAVFSGLDKITGRIISFEVGMNETVQFGSLLITDRVCYTRPPTEAPQTDTFVQVDQIAVDKTTKRIFSGWMFAASPGLNALDQPVYDIWLTDCRGAEQLIPSPPSATQSTPEPEEPEAAAPAGAPNPAAAASPAPDTSTKARHVRQRDTAPAENNGPVEVGPPPGFQPPPNNGDGGGGGGDQSPPDNPDSGR